MLPGSFLYPWNHVPDAFERQRGASPKREKWGCASFSKNLGPMDGLLQNMVIPTTSFTSAIPACVPAVVAFEMTGLSHPCCPALKLRAAVPHRITASEIVDKER